MYSSDKPLSASDMLDCQVLLWTLGMYCVNSEQELTVLWDKGRNK